VSRLALVPKACQSGVNTAENSQVTSNPWDLDSTLMGAMSTGIWREEGGKRLASPRVITRERTQGNVRAAHVESIQHSLLRNRVVAFRTPAMVSQPDIMTARRCQYPVCRWRISDLQPRLLRSPLNNDPPVHSRTARYTPRMIFLNGLLRRRRRRMNEPRGDGDSRNSCPRPQIQSSRS